MINNGDGTVTLTIKEYDEMIEQLRFLDCLEACGVDNWQGYEDAHDMMDEDLGD